MRAPLVRQPTVRQIEILRFIRDFTASHGFGPTFVEIGDACRIGSTNGVNCHLVLIEKRGLIERRRMTARSIVVTRAGVAALRGGP